MLFVNWANSESTQQSFKEIDTKQAIESATASVLATQSAGTQSALAVENTKRLENAELIFDETFDEGSEFVAENSDGDLPYFREGIPEILIPWRGYDIWTSGQEVGDFASEIDCISGGAFCGIAYAVKTINPELSAPDFYYASGINRADSCHFNDSTKKSTSTRDFICNFPSAATESLLHHLRVERIRHNLKFYVNGELMDERVLDNPEAANGEVGFYFGKFNDESGIQYVQVDNFKVWKLP